MSKVKKEIKTQKNFSYTMDDITLTFGLSVDTNLTALKFKKLLEEALIDVDKAIKEIK